MGVDGKAYTNSLEALQSNLAAGHRIFEVDLAITSDGKVVCLHDWDISTFPEICRFCT